MRILLFISLLFSLLSLHVFASQDISMSVGGDRDIHGCIGSAGYTWNSKLQKCVRSWELSQRQLLRGYSWKLQSFNGKTYTQDIVLDFQQSTYRAKICNGIQGRYVLFGDKIIQRPGMSTMMYCEGIMDIENAFSFRKARFIIQDDLLTVTTQKGDVFVWKMQMNQD